VFLFAAMFATIMAFLALLIDFGGAALTYQRAQVAVNSAAFAAAQGVDLGVFRQANQIQLDPELASDLAGSYATLNSRGHLSHLQLVVQGDRVWVVGEMDYPTIFAGAIGIPTIHTRVVSSAVSAYGISQWGQ
jgi:Flp pilus assembly protein TadG